MDANATAADAAEEVQELLAEIGFRRPTVRPARRSLAVLGATAIDRYRARMKVTVPGPRSDLFRQLTRGLLRRLRAEWTTTATNVAGGRATGGVETVGWPA